MAQLLASKLRPGMTIDPCRRAFGAVVATHVVVTAVHRYLAAGIVVVNPGPDAIRFASTTMVRVLT